MKVCSPVPQSHKQSDERLEVPRGHNSLLQLAGQRRRRSSTVPDPWPPAFAHTLPIWLPKHARTHTHAHSFYLFLFIQAALLPYSYALQSCHLENTSLLCIITSLFSKCFYLFPDKWSVVTEWVTVERSLLNVNLCLSQDGIKEQLTEVRRGALQCLNRQPLEWWGKRE